MKLSYLLCALVFFLGGCNPPSSAKTSEVEVKLLSNVTTVQPDQKFLLGVHFSMQPDWHVYWKNPGDSGLPPKIKWSSKIDSLRVDDLLWPAPSRIPVGPLMNYGYDGSVLLIAPAVITNPNTGTGKFRITANIKWLACKVECVPGEATLSIPIRVLKDGGQVSSTDASLFSKTEEHLPYLLDDVSYAVEETNDRVNLTILSLGDRFLPSEATFIPENKSIIDNAGAQISSKADGTLTLSLPRVKGVTKPITRLKGVLLSDEGWDASRKIKAVSIDTSPSGKSEASLANDNTLNGSAEVTQTPQYSFLFLLILAILGGLILNAMPCVFPVLAIKILSFVEQSKKEEGSVGLHAASFAAGVVGSFVALAGIVIALRNVGEAYGWGFQLQYPPFVAAMAFVFLILALLYLFEVPLFFAVQKIAGKHSHHSGYIGSFLHGALATAVATPCTAPFMGAAVAAAFTLSTPLALIVFAFIGLGMSIPYLVLTTSPILLSRLPRPGPWMVTFKQAMAFPMLASAGWLLWVLARQCGVAEGALVPVSRFLWGSLIVSFGLWSLSRSVRRSALFRSVCLIITLFGLWYGFPRAVEIERSQKILRSSANTDQGFPDSYGLTWYNYSEAKLQEGIQDRRLIYVDFTAAWCVTCQVNKQIVFGSEEVRDEVRKRNVLLLRGDWTSQDTAVTVALQRHGRSSVPLNLIWLPGKDKPVVLPAILTSGTVLHHLRQSGVTVENR